MMADIQTLPGHSMVPLLVSQVVNVNAFSRTGSQPQYYPIFDNAKPSGQGSKGKSSLAAPDPKKRVW